MLKMLKRGGVIAMGGVVENVVKKCIKSSKICMKIKKLGQHRMKWLWKKINISVKIINYLTRVNFAGAKFYSREILLC